jgi:hypothetical protein
MKQRIMIGVMVCFLLSITTGCDQIKKLFGGNVVTPDSTPPAVKGTLIAQVGSIPITLEELNKEVDLIT